MRVRVSLYRLYVQRHQLPLFFDGSALQHLFQMIEGRRGIGRQEIGRGQGRDLHRGRLELLLDRSPLFRQRLCFVVEAEAARVYKADKRIIKLITVQEILDEQHVQKM